MKKEIEQHLIERSRNGDAEAFGEIYVRLKDGLYGFAFRMTNRTSVAEEITQEVFMFLIENPEKYDEKKGSLFSFLCGVARNKIFNRLKKSGLRLEVNNFETENIACSNGNSPIGKLIDKEISEKIEECVAKLSPLQKEVLLLRELSGFSYDEIAEITNTNVGVVKGRLHRARRALAKELAPHMKSEEVNYDLH